MFLLLSVLLFWGEGVGDEKLIFTAKMFWRDIGDIGQSQLSILILLSLILLSM